MSLEPCPFCGGEVERVLPPSSELSEYIRHKEHGVCPLEFTAVTTDGGDTMVAAWNTRAEAQRLPLTPKLIEHMVQRFLMWRLPDNFRPDAGISFKPTFNDHLDPPMRHQPMGTNLLDCVQAKEMILYMLEGMQDRGGGTDGNADATTIEQQAAEIARLREALERANEAHWYYLGDDCSSDQCRFGIDECITEDFEWDNKQEGDHVLQISGARPVPDMWVALHYFTNAEKDERGDDEGYTYTVHATEDEARKSLETRND